MNLEPAPRLSKSIFFAIDAVLVITAFVIVYFSRNPYAPLPFVSAVLCLVLATVIAMVPLLVDYEASRAEYVQQERERANEQIQRLHAATESLARAAAQIKAVEEAVHKTAHAAESLPYRMQEKLAEFNQALAEKEGGEREALEQELAGLRAANSDQLKAVATKIQQAAAEWAALESGTRQQLGGAQEAAARLAEKLKGTVTGAQDAVGRLDDQLKDTIKRLDARISELGDTATRAANPSPQAAAPAAPAGGEVAIAGAADASASPAVSPVDFAPAPEPAPEAAPPSIPSAVIEPAPMIESISVRESVPPAVAEPKPRKPRAPRKPRPEEVLAAMSETSGAAVVEVAVEAAPASAEPMANGVTETSEEARTDALRADAIETSVSADGATRLLVTAYIGIGNKLFLRGDGPGLSWERGVPMQFVSIGKWGWSTDEATAPVACKFYKNDATAALSGEVLVEPGKHVEVSVLF